MAQTKKKKKNPYAEIPKQFKDFNIIPLKPKSKLYNHKISCSTPQCKEDYEWKKWQRVFFPYKLDDYKGNFAVVLGDGINYGKYLVQVDLDDPKYLKYFENEKTLINKSARGYHVFLLSKVPERARNNYPLPHIELRTHEGQYCPIPPSIHPSGKKYEVYKDEPILVVENATEWVKDKLSELKDQFPKEQTSKSGMKQFFPVEQDRKLSEDDIDKLVSHIKPFYIPDYRNDIVYSLSGSLFKEHVAFESAEQVIKRLADGDEEYSNRMVILKRTYESEVSEEEIKGFSGIKEVLTAQGLDENMMKTAYMEISKIVSAPKHWQSLVGSLGSDTAVVVNPVSKEIQYEKRSYPRGKPVCNLTKVVQAYPQKVIVYDSPLTYEPRRYEVVFESKLRKTPFKLGPALPKDITGMLDDSGYIINSRLAKDVVSASLNLYIEHDLAELQEEIQQPGFYLNDQLNEMMSVKYDYKEPTRQDIRDALEIIEKLRKWYPSHEDKLSTSIKWGLIAPFSYVKKQMGGWIPDLVHFGTGGSGKTTLGHVSLYMYCTPGYQNETSGDGLNTPYRMGERRSKMTFPVLADEAGGLFENNEVMEVLKVAIEKEYSRGKKVGRDYQRIPALNSIIYTSNTSIPSKSALVRRLYILNYSLPERKSEKEKRQFDLEFNYNDKDKSEFNKLKALGAFAYKFLSENINLTKEDFKTISDKIMTEIYAYAEVDMPEWICKWAETETMDNVTETIEEMFRVFLVERINQESKRITVVDDNGRTLDPYDDYKMKKATDYKMKVWNVLNERLIPWIYLVRSSRDEKDYVYITSHVTSAFKDSMKVDESLANLAYVMGTKSSSHWIAETKKTKRSIKIEFGKFLDFMYPTEDM